MHPLSHSLAVVRAANPYYDITLTAQPRGARLAQWTGNDPTVWQQRLAAQRRGLPEAAETTITAAFVQAYCWPVLVGPVACWVLCRRVPSLDPATTAIRDERGIPAALELGSGRFICLPDDPAATHSDATVVATPAALAAALHHEIVAHCRPVVAFLATQSRLSDASLWMLVADTLAGIITRIHDAHQPLPPAALATVVAAVCHAAGSPLVLPHYAVATAGTRVMHRRLSCCFWHKRPGGGVCANCPRRSPADQDRAVAAVFAAGSGRR